MNSAPWRIVALTTLSTLFAVSSASADTVTGRVVNHLGQGVVGVELDFSGGVNPVNPFTGADGFFTLLVPAGTYDIDLLPPDRTLMPRQLLDVTISGLTNLGVIVLEQGFELTGLVLTTAGVPVANADTNTYDEATGEKLFTPNDNTDALGNLRYVVPAGTFRVLIKTPPLLDLVALEIEGVVVAGPTSIGTVVMQPGVRLTGTVIDSTTMLPVAGVDLDVDDADTGARIPTPADNTDAAGNFAVVTPTGLFHLTFNPPPGSPYVALQRLNVTVSVAGSLGTFPLARGVAISGTVLGPASAPVAGANIDVTTSPGGAVVYTPHDGTDATGAFRVVVPSGTYRVTVKPKQADLLVGARTGPLTVTTNTVLPTFQLVAGVVLSGTISAYDGSPEPEADLDVIDRLTGDELVTPGDNTDASGAYAVVVPNGTWDIRIQTRKGSLSRVETVTGVTVAGATTLNRQLSLVPVFAYFATAGVPTVPQGGPVFAFLGFFNPTPLTQPTVASIVLVDPAGGESTVFPPLPLPLPPAAGGFTPLLLGLPPVNPAFLGQEFRLELRFDDPVSGAEHDHDSFRLIIQ